MGGSGEGPATTTSRRSLVLLLLVVAASLAGCNALSDGRGDRAPGDDASFVAGTAVAADGGVTVSAP